VAAVRDAMARLSASLRDEQARRVRGEKLATVGRMAAGIAHEVGNPLAAILSFAHVLRLRVGDAGAGAALDGMEREAARIDRIVRGLLDFARPRRVTPAAVDVDELAQGAVRLLQEQGVLRRLAVSTALESRGARVFAERHELEQMLVNLLLNAADAVPAPGRVAVSTRAVSVDALRHARARRAGDDPTIHVPRAPSPRVAQWLAGAPRSPRTVVQLVVADSGPGIADADAERIFDPFFTTKQPGKGTGLGLAIVASTVERLGGAVWVQRAREGGAAFVVLLPVAEGPPVGIPAVGHAAEQLPLPLGSAQETRGVSTPAGVT
jgi:signal transduction histidine kinase